MVLPVTYCQMCGREGGCLLFPAHAKGEHPESVRWVCAMCVSPLCTLNNPEKDADTVKEEKERIEGALREQDKDDAYRLVAHVYLAPKGQCAGRCQGCTYGIDFHDADTLSCPPSDKEKIAYAVECAHCGRPFFLHVTAAQWEEYEKPGRAHVQTIFPDMPKEERELLISGTCPLCWYEMFGEGEE